MLNDKEKKYIEDSEEELKELLKTLCVIPAPSNHEEKRAEFVKQWINSNGFEAFKDEADNVIWPVNVTKDCNLFVISAHTDVVFSDTDGLPFHEDSEKYYCPGIGDDTARLAILLVAARYFAGRIAENKRLAKIPTNATTNASTNYSINNLKDNSMGTKPNNFSNDELALKPSSNPDSNIDSNIDSNVDSNTKKNTGFLIVANTGEEGLGNLRGTKKLFETYGKRIKHFITIDGNPDALITKAVGSHRYKVTVSTKGGHSYNDYGNDNAIEKLAEIIEALYKIDIPQKENTKTTLNVGSISGGTSVNTIAEEADMLFEYRSDDADCLSYMKTAFENVIENFKKNGLNVSYDTIGIRPCGKAEDEKEFRSFVDFIKSTESEAIGVMPQETSGSTDANLPLSLGIPAVCIGAGIAKKTHTREEYVYKDSLKEGSRFVLSLLNEVYGRYC